MPSSIRTNVAALSARGSLVRNSVDLAKTTQQLASGKRINSAADDAAGLAISSLMSAKLASIKQNQDNIAQGMSMAKIVDGALGDQANILTKLVSLAIQCANGTLGDAQRGATIQREAAALVLQFDKIGNSAEFNGVELLANDVNIDIQAGAVNHANSRLAIAITQSLGAHADFHLDNLALDTVAHARDGITLINTAIANMAGRRAQIGAVISQFAQAMESTLTNEISTEEALGQITDADIAAAVSSLAAQSVLVQAATEMLAQANKHPQILLQLLRGG